MGDTRFLKECMGKSEKMFVQLVGRAAEAVVDAYDAVQRAPIVAADLDEQTFGELVASGQLLLFCSEQIANQAAAVMARSAEVAEDNSAARRFRHEDSLAEDHKA